MISPNFFHVFVLVQLVLLMICSCTEVNTQQAPLSKASIGQTQSALADKVNSKINWLTLQETQKLIQKEAKPVFVMVYTNWCSNSKKFDQTTYQDAEIIKILNNEFYPVKLNAHEPDDITFKGKTYANPNYDAVRGLNKSNAYHEVLFELEAKSIPSTVFLNKDLIVIGSEMGYKDSGKFNNLLEQYNSN